MVIFLKAQLSSLIATAADFLVTIYFVEVLGLSYTTATVNGAIGGAVTNFTINKFWSFNQENTGIKKQVLKYGIVWLGSISLNVIGSNLIIKIFNTSYVLSKIIVSIIVGMTFNYILQKYYVFSTIRKTNKK